MKGTGIEFPGRKIARPGELPRGWLFLHVERADGRLLIDRRAIGNEFFVLPVVLQLGVRTEQAINQLTFLILRTRRGQCEHNKTKRENATHVAQAGETGGGL